MHIVSRWLTCCRLHWRAQRERLWFYCSQYIFNVNKFYNYDSTCAVDMHRLSDKSNICWHDCYQLITSNVDWAFYRAFIVMRAFIFILWIVYQFDSNSKNTSRNPLISESHEINLREHFVPQSLWHHQLGGWDQIYGIKFFRGEEILIAS